MNQPVRQRLAVTTINRFLKQFWVLSTNSLFSAHLHCVRSFTLTVLAGLRPNSISATASMSRVVSEEGPR